MIEAEKRRQSVTLEELEETRAGLTQTRVPSPRNPKPRDLDQPAELACMRCGHGWSEPFKIDERTCPQCRSNSVRWLRVKT